MYNSNKDKQKCIEANLLYEKGEEGYFEKMLELLSDGDLPRALHNKAFYCYEHGYLNKEETLSLLDKVIGYDSNSYKSYWLAGKIHFDSKNYGKALEYFYSAEKINPDIILHNYIGSVLHFMGRFGESAEYFRKAIHTHDDRMLYNYVNECILLGDTDTARKCINNIRLGEIDEIDIGRLYFLLGEYSRTCELYLSEWDSIMPNAVDLGIYTYSLKQIGYSRNHIDNIVNGVINNYKDMISDFDDEYAISKYTAVMNEVSLTAEKIKSGLKPEIILEPKEIMPCMLYYCIVHDNDIL